MNLVFDIALCALILGVAAMALLGRRLFASVAFFIVYGLLIALAWLSLNAIDVALAEAAIGAGVTGVLLIGAWQALNAQSALDPDPVAHWITRVFAGLGCLAIGGLLALAILAMPGGTGLTTEVIDTQGQLDLGNSVTAVLLGFRAYDTLLESIVLLAALVAVWSLTPQGLWGGIPGPRHRTRPDGVMASFGRLLPPAGLIAGVYLVWAGSDAPGGAFQAGTVLAAAWILAVLAGLQDEPEVTSPLLRAALLIGPALFLLVGAVGAGFGGFLAYPEGFEKPVILAIEYALALSIAATLALLVAGPPRRPGGAR